MLIAIIAGAGVIVLLLVVILIVTCCRKKQEINLDDYIPKNQIANWGQEKVEDISMEEIEAVSSPS